MRHLTSRTFFLRKHLNHNSTAGEGECLELLRTHTMQSFLFYYIGLYYDSVLYCIVYIILCYIILHWVTFYYMNIILYYIILYYFPLLANNDRQGASDM